jgi:23S rRNA (guanosine2251-2'-O)-methyltransferase
MAEVVEGRHPVLETLRSERLVEEVLVASGVDDATVLREISEAARARGIPVREAGRDELDRLSVRGAHQGVVALVGEFAYQDLSSVLAIVREEPRALIVLLDHVLDPGNLGAVIRSAEALGAAAVVIEKRRSAQVTQAAVKTAAGAVAHLPVVRVTNLAQTIEALKEEGFWSVGASQDADVPVWAEPMPSRCALVVGSEGRGLSRLVRERCDLHARIPLPGTTSSLNVAQAVTVLAYEWARSSEVG